MQQNMCLMGLNTMVQGGRKGKRRRRKEKRKEHWYSEVENPGVKAWGQLCDIHLEHLKMTS